MIFHDNELDDNLKEKLAQLSPTPARDPEQAAQGRAAFLSKARLLRARNAHLVAAKGSKQGFLQALFGKRLSFAPLAIALVIAIGLIFGGGWGTVYAAQGSLPNDILYPIKLATENFRLTFTTDPVERVNLLTTFASRRIEEATKLVSIGEPIPEELPGLVDEQYEEIFSITASMEEGTMQEALKGIQIHLRDQDKIMSNAMNGLPDGKEPQLTQLRQTLTARHQLAQMGLGEPNEFQHQFRHQLGKPTLPITPTLTTTITSTITSTVTITPEVTVTLTITPGHHGPGPCEVPGACTPPAEEHGPFEHKGTPPGPDDHEGYGPGSEQGQGPQYPTATPTPPEEVDEPTPTPKPSNSKSKNKGNFGGNKGKP